MSRCDKRAPAPHPPEGFTREAAAGHPTYKYYITVPSAQCELEHNHGTGTPAHDVGRRHRCGNLLWWDPQLLLVGGVAFDPDPEPAP